MQIELPLYRRSDPWTSREAAATVDRKLNAKHQTMLAVIRHMGPFTDDDASDRAVSRGYFTRHEQARRVIRTLRDHLLIVPCVDEHGVQRAKINSSGRKALLWEVNDEK